MKRKTTETATDVVQKPHECTYQGCGKSFKWKLHLETHERTHSGEKPFACTHEGCGKTFSRYDDCKTHERTHTGALPFKCTMCARTFSTSSNRGTHVMRYHTDKTSIEYKAFKEKVNKATSLRYNNDMEYRAACLARNRLWGWMKANGGKKTGATEALVGCTWAELVKHLNKNNNGLKVGDKGVHIDHIRPVASFLMYNNAVEQRACMNWNNLQLMVGTENLQKGANWDPVEYAASAAGKAIEALRVKWAIEFSSESAIESESESESESAIDSESESDDE